MRGEEREKGGRREEIGRKGRRGEMKGGWSK